MEFLIWFDEQEKRAKVIRKKINETGHEFLEKNNLLDDGYTTEIDGAKIHIYETKSYTKKQIDVDALKEQGLYETFLKETTVKGSIRVQVEYD